MSRDEPLGKRVRRARASFLNLFAKNDKDRWDRSYAEGHWTFLDSLEQAPRHHVIAGMLRALDSEGSSVLDVGCGTGALVPHLPDNVLRYVGIDLSREAIRICREKAGSSTRSVFAVTSFDDYSPRESFHVVVFNEMLYYYPMRRIPEVFSHARRLLGPAGGSIIVSVHNRSLKGRGVWRRLSGCMASAESTEVADVASRTAWRIARYDVEAPRGRDAQSGGP